MKKFLKIFLGILFLALLVGTFVFLWNKTRPVKVVYTLATPVHDTIQAPDLGYYFRGALQGRRPCKTGRRHRYGEGHSRNGNPQCRRIPRDGSPALARPDPQGVRTHRSPLCQRRGIAGGVREGADHPAPGRRGVPECRRQPGNRQNRYYQPIQRFKQHPDTLHHHGYDPRRTDQGRQLGDPGQHLQRRHHDRHGRRHGRHALPGQCR